MTKLLTLALVIALVAPVAAQSPIRLLPAFALTAADGTATTSQALTQARPWVLLIAQQPCRSCDSTLAVLNAGLSAEQALRIVVVLSGASAAEAAGVRARYARLSNTGWFRDEARAALPALGVGGSPVVIGLTGDRVFWTRNVSAMSAGDLESLVTSWIR